MSSRLTEIFEDKRLVEKIKRRLPYLFQLAELESSRAGKIGMEVGSVRERIIVTLLIYKFGEANIETEMPITEPEVDTRLFGEPLSIKTITGKGFKTTLRGVDKCQTTGWQSELPKIGRKRSASEIYGGLSVKRKNSGTVSS